MADRRPVRIENAYDGNVTIYQWTGVESTDTVFPAILPNKADKYVTVQGINGHTVVLQGAAAPATAVPVPIFLGLNNVTGAPLSFTDDGSGYVLENAYQYLPVVTGGVGGVTVYLMGS